MPFPALVPRSPRARRTLFAVGATLLLIATACIVQFAVRVRDLRAHRATGPSWKFPSRVFSDDVGLVAGRVLPRDYLLAELAVRGYDRTSQPEPRPGSYALADGDLVIALRGFSAAPDPRGRGGPERVRLRLGDSTLIAVERLGGVPGAPPPDLAHPPRLEPLLVTELFDAERVRRTEVSLDRVPQAVQDAVVSSEDRRFYSHLGLDLRANLRALGANLRSGGVRQGASTITQQLARGLFLGRERTLSRKLSEAVIAMGLEVSLSKRQILEMYLNSVYWGQSGGSGIGGIAEAAHAYFDTPVESLRVEQGALLAGIIPAPASLSPFEHPDLALAKRNEVLHVMVETGKLSAAEAERFAALPLGVREGPPPVERFSSYTGYVRDVLARRLPKNAPGEWGLAVFTTLDPAWQEAAETGLRVGLASLEGGSRRGPRLQGAFVALNPEDGTVRALVGGRDPKPGDFNRATQAERQTGSAIKPIVYTTALAGGSGSYTPASTVPDLPRTFGEGRWTWTPHNDDGEYHETVTLAKALARSINVATANVVEAVGPGEVARMAERFGLGALKPVMSIGLGTNEVSPLALTSAYAVFAARGLRHDPTPLRNVLDGAGREVLHAETRTEDVLSPTLAALMTGLLEDVVTYGVGYPLRAVYGFDRPVAGKTGTTNDFHDAWFVGFTPHVVAGVWVGFDLPKSLGRVAAHTAIPVWARIVGTMLTGFPRTPFASDGGIEYAFIDPWTGSLAGPGGGMRVPFLAGTAPTQFVPDTLGYGGEENLDSLYAGDTLAVPEPGAAPEMPPDTITTVEPDTSVERP